MKKDLFDPEKMMMVLLLMLVMKVVVVWIKHTVMPSIEPYIIISFSPNSTL